ncbi:MAG: hypothetical protein C5B43_03065 [Verrucomicrobia bacterium]|nr:MAG: hypothetical protein C5B43_03065 [Verrucomicrobiota bacterium]
MTSQTQWGEVNLGVDVLQGHGEQNQPGKADYDKNHPGAKHKQQYNPGRNQELNLPADIFPMNHFHRENPENQNTGKAVPLANVHERIKEMLGQGVPRREAIAKAKAEADKAKRGDVGTITLKDVYRSKYQAETPAKKISPFSEQVQGFPYI